MSEHSKFQKMLHNDAAPGVILCISAIFAMITMNSSLAGWYHHFLEIPIMLEVGSWHLEMHLLHWINDALMAVFFLIVGLEIKKEILEGELSSFGQVILPGIAAAGGMLVPALIFVAFNLSNPEAIKGWAIPSATDIAFALGIISLFGKRVPLSLKVFLTALAIFDDLGAIVIIALFYSSDMSFTALGTAGVILTALFALNRARVTKLTPYLCIGVFLWYFVLKSGIHATLAGVMLAFAIPSRDQFGHSPMKHLTHTLHGWVNFLILPIFGFANAGVSLAGVGIATIFEPVSLGVCLGLFAGKQIGIFTFTYAAVKSGIAKMPSNSDWKTLYGVSIMGGIGFTMSLFVGNLAFSNPALLTETRIGILLGSFLSGSVGYVVVSMCLKAREAVASDSEKPSFRILLAEDSLLSQNLVASLLENNGHSVEVGDSGDRLVELCEDNKFDLILLDIETPVIEAIEAIQLLRKQEKGTHVPILVMGADRPEHLPEGVDGFVKKPLDNEDLVLHIKSVH